MLKKGDTILITVYPFDKGEFTERGIVTSDEDCYGCIEVKNFRGHYLSIEPNEIGKLKGFYAGQFKINPLPVSVIAIKELANEVQ